MGQGEQEARSQIQHRCGHTYVWPPTRVRTLRSNFRFGFCFGSWGKFSIEHFCPPVYKKKKKFFFGCIFNNLNIKSVRIQPLKGLRRAADADGSSGQQLHEGSPPPGPCLGLPSKPPLGRHWSLRAPPLPANPILLPPETRLPSDSDNCIPRLLSFMPGSHPTQPAPGGARLY